MKGSNRSCKNTDGYDRRNLVDNQPPEFLETFIHKFIAYKNCGAAGAFPPSLQQANES